MKKINLTFILLTLFGCKSKFDKNNEIISNSFGKEWKLKKVKDRKLKNEYAKKILVFYKDSTYDFFYVENGIRKGYGTSDLNVGPNHWFFDLEGGLHINNFNNIKLLKLEFNKLVFYDVYGKHKIKFEFICDECKPLEE